MKIYYISLSAGYIGGYAIVVTDTEINTSIKGVHVFCDGDY